MVPRANLGLVWHSLTTSRSLDCLSFQTYSSYNHIFGAMERPAKRQKLSSSSSQPYPTNHARQDEELSCTHADAKTEGFDGRPTVPTPTINKHDLRRRYVSDGSNKNGRNQLPRSQADAPIVPRAPDTTVVATAVDVNVQDGNTTIANTVVLASDATVVSFASIGVLTVSAQPTTSATTITGTTISDSSQTSLSSLSSSDTSPPAGSLTTSILSASSIPSDYNSSAISISSDRTTTITLTSTLNVSFLNGTVITLPNQSDTTAPATLTSSSPNTDSRADQTGHSTVASAATALSSPIAASATGSAGNGPSAGSSSGTGAAGFGSPTTAASSATSSSSQGGSEPGPATPTVVGGVVGGVAGLAFLLLVLLTLLRWYRKRLQARGQLPEQIAAGSAAGGGPGAANQMSSRSSHTPFAAAILSSTRRWRPQSSATTATAVTDYNTATDSERGFQRIAGRKIGPVIGTGTDQYGGNYGAFEKDFPEGRLTRGAPSSSRAEPSNNEERGLAESSFYFDSHGFYGGKGDDSPATPTLVPSTTGHTRGSTRDLTNTYSIGEDARDSAPEGYAVMRPSPARTPMTSSPSNSSLRLPIQQGPLMEPGAPPTPALPSHLIGRRPDGVGRSLPSQDGSRGSRFTESV